MASPPEAEAGAVLTIDLSALAANWRELAALSGSADCAAVVKADAYGLGIAQAVPALWQAGARVFFVAHLAEAIAARKAAPSATIYVLNGLLPDAFDTYAVHDLRPVLGSRDEIEAFSSYCNTTGSARPGAVHVDTGMNRLGLDMAEAALLAEPGPGGLAFTPSLLLSHLACADEPGHPLTAKQITRFAQLRGLFPGVPGSLANSAGITLSEAHHDLTRPGIALYGGEFVQGRPALRPTVKLEAPIIQVRDLRAGDTVGYGATWRATGPARIAVLSVGYGDGYPRAASTTPGVSVASVMVDGVACPLAGRVSMDLIAIDVTVVPQAKRGTPVTLIGEGITVDAIGRASGTIGYEVLTRLGQRYHRRYLSAITA